MRGRLAVVALAAELVFGCDGGGVESEEPVCAPRGHLFEKSPGPALEGPGWHRVYAQGAEAPPNDDQQFGMAEHSIDIANGDHFLLSEGAYVEWTYPVSAPLTGHIFVHVARDDDPGVVGLYELDLVHQGEATGIFAIEDEAPGGMGYSPFEDCRFSGAASEVRPSDGDHLRLRATNLSGGNLGIVSLATEYYTWIEVEVDVR